jgi:hypothetical protein
VNGIDPGPVPPAATAPEIPDEAREAMQADPVGANLASLNEIITEMVARVSPDPAFAAMVRDLLREHSWSLGYPFQGEHNYGAAVRRPTP